MVRNGTGDENGSDKDWPNWGGMKADGEIGGDRRQDEGERGGGGV